MASPCWNEKPDFLSPRDQCPGSKRNLIPTKSKVSHYLYFFLVLGNHSHNSFELCLLHPHPFQHLRAVPFLLTQTFCRAPSHRVFGWSSHWLLFPPVLCSALDKSSQCSRSIILISSFKNTNNINISKIKLIPSTTF